MSSAYLAALRDYPRRVRFPVIMVFSGLLLMPILKGYFENAEWTGKYAFLIGALVLVIWTGTISGHLKQVLARPQSRLFPDYGKVQVSVALLLIFPAALTALGGALLAGFSPLGALAITLFLVALYWTWPYLFDRGGLLVLFGPSMAWWLTLLAEEPRVRNWPGWANLGLSEALWFGGLLLVSGAILALVTRRMLRLTESSFEYRSDPSIGWRQGSSPDSDTPFINLFQRLLPWLGRYRVRARSSIFAASPRERITQWRLGMGPRSPMVSGFSMAAIVALVGVFFRLYKDEPTDVGVGLLVTYLFIFPFNRYSYTQRRREHFASESLFPASRERFVREMGLATAIEIFQCWFFLCLGILAVRAAGLFVSVPWSWFPFLAIFSLCTTIFGIGFAPWTLRLNGDKIPSFVLTMTVLILGVGLVGVLYALVGLEAPLVWLTAPLLLAGLGVFSGWHGYRKWCTLELGRNDL